MFKFVLCVFAAILVTGYGQDCNTLPKAGPHDCCMGINPTALTPALTTECGLAKDAPYTSTPPCDVCICMLKKLNLLTPDNKILDKDAFVTAAAVQHPAEFKALLGPAYDACKDMMNKQPCGHFSFMMCIKGQMLKSCPTPIPSANPGDCAATKDFFDKCFGK